ncbi:DNA mismatch endonuclease Vsr [Pseudomonas syringae]|uniref:very short patch repair endonuclease n=1 Tax=Pseudomonas TaxID=286 RepID=UPI00093055FC|nr:MULTISPECIES: DNA mismatch endonuclease Vsr [Pseudomonas]MCH5511829.1 DNA mismatch endonuclease Vsr [Pseudomonas syringae pv. syringae]MCH5640695.1 DNA mismatch endonuclease Vsr [Pseudomonas syringae pv. syringae]MCH7429756.1 DNA mismatch endonuclease Vsr [Pseudomonas syringae pv. syringae]PPS36829.1 very short patch repair endonuclease [Pseudomonas syringae]
MIDVVDSATRSRMMAGIQGKNTSPELLIRKALHARGFRFRIHAKHLPGKPDLILPKYKAVIFIHGCFWHGHDCRFFKVPKTRTEFWLEKIGKNKTRDSTQIASLQFLGWRVLVIWECAVRCMKKQHSTLLVDLVSNWVVSGSEYLQLEEVDLNGFV